VPSDLPPLGTSRYPDNAYRPPTLRVAPGNVMPTQPQAIGNGTARIEVVGGQPVIFIGDRMFALPAVNATTSSSSLGGNAAMDPTTKQTSDPAALSTQGSVSGMSFGPPRSNSQSPFAGLDLATLKNQQSLKKQELRTVEQTEVLQASHQSDAWRASMIEKKRCLIVELDALRKSITALESENGATQPHGFLGPIGTGPASSALPPFIPQLQQPVPQPMYGFPAANPYASMMMYQPPYGAFPSFPAAEPAPFVPPPANPPHSPGSPGRRSHAIEIKPPQEESKKQHSSALNPKSPTYEPPAKSDPVRNTAPPTPSPPKRSPWRIQAESQTDRVGHRVPSQKLSLSSIDTADFFPTNAHEHSSTRLAPRANEPKQPSNESMAAPSTPEKRWPASPWNGATSGQSRNNEPIAKLTSWPEAFGKQRSSSSLRQSAVDQPSTAMLERAPVMGSYTQNTTSSNNELFRTESQRTGTDENWPFSRKAVTHVPSTYQEGYQAGYDHIGMPDSFEVLQGFIQGLLHFISDESKKGRTDHSSRTLYTGGVDSRTPSLRGLVAGSMPHDSAVSMSFNRNNGSAERQENVRASKESLSVHMRREPAYGPEGNVRDAPASQAFFNDTAYVARQRNVSSMQYANPAGLFPEKLMAGRQQAGFPTGENELGRLGQDKGIASRADTSMSSGGFPRQFTGTQVQNRGFGTPMGMQRFYPTPKEMSANAFNGSNEPGLQQFANHRMSGLDGAMDDLAELTMDTHIDDNRASTSRAADPAAPVEAEEQGAGCFRSSSYKGKQRATGSPTKSSATGRDTVVSSPNPPSSPKKSAELSPAKAKLEQVTNKFRRVKKDDPRMMSPEDKKKRSDKWRQRFHQMKKAEIEEIEQHRKISR
jgi:hypothetical protein